MKKELVIGTRGSRLAVAQAKLVASNLLNRFPDTRISMKTISTRGDEEQREKLDEIGGEGAFTKELEEALLAREIDIAVHSLKDLPTVLPERLVLAGVLERYDPRDVFVSTSGIKLVDLPSHSRVATGSLRRVAQLKAVRPDLEIVDIRGNIETRLMKLTSAGIEGAVMAAAGLLRMEMGNVITEYLPLEDFLPSVGQGAIGLEVFADDVESVEAAYQASHLPSWCAVRAERAFLRELGGGCRSPIAALGVVSDNTLTLYGMVLDTNGDHILRVRRQGSTNGPEELGHALAEEAMTLGANELISG